jgi:hypothetical protein
MIQVRRTFRVAILMVVAVAVFPAAALAESPHLKGGVKPNPAFTDNGLTLTGTVAYAGLGNFDTTQNLSATAQPTADCVNPGSGEHRPPGQNPAEVNVTGSTAVPASDIKNGNVTISTTTNPPVTPVAGAPDCPNTQWSENITDMAFTSATFTVLQNGGTVITVSCTFSTPTKNGAVPANNYTCTVS